MTYPFITFITLLALWSAVWKAIALWKSARNNHLVWFIFILIFNSAGILPIIYILFFSKPKDTQPKQSTPPTPTPTPPTPPPTP